MTLRSAFSAIRIEAALFGAMLIGTSTLSVLAWVFPGQAGRSPWHVGVEMWSSVSGSAQLYLDTGAGYNEPQSVIQPVEGGTANELVFEIRDPVLQHIRFDPLMTGGVVKITRFWYEDGGARRRRYLPVDVFRPANQISSMGRDGSGVTVVMPIEANDPQLYADLGRSLVAPRPEPPWTYFIALVAGAGLLAYGIKGGNAVPEPTGAWTCAIGVALASLALTWPLHRSFDYPIWDEANNLGEGRAFWKDFGLGPVSSSPVYLLWYAVWTKFFAGGSAIYAGRYALETMFSLVSLVLARRWFNSWLAATFVALGVALSLWQLTTPYYVYDAALVLFMAGLAVADRSRVSALGFLLLATLTRLEYGFALGATLVLWSLAYHLGGRQNDGGGFRRKGIAPWLPLVAAGLVAIRVESWESGIGRGWFAFEQHYAVSLVASGHAPGINPWIEYPALIHRDFPGATSLKDAFRINPTAVIEHVGRNLGNAPGLVAHFFVTSHGGEIGGWCGIGLLVCAAFLSVLCGAEQARGVRTWLRERRWSLLMAAGGVVTILPGLVVYAETAYLLPILPLIWALAALIAAWVRAETPVPLGKWGSLAVACLAIFGGAVVVQTAQRPFDVVAPYLPIRETVDILRRTFPDKTRLLGVAASTYVDYLGGDWVGIEPFDSVGGPRNGSANGMLDRLIAQTHPNVILVNSQWEGLAAFDRAGVEALPRQGWTKMPVPDGTLYFRKGAIVPATPQPTMK